jgi:primosomal protein N' (replication factor Y) (superfamily II helicase)
MMPALLFAEIAVNVPQVSGLFHYHVPPDLVEQIAPGSLVIVPFGQRQVQGVVLRLLTEASISETKAIEAVVDPEPVINPVQMELARWISENTLTPLATCFGPMIPPGLGQLADTLFHLNPVQLYLSTLGTLQQRLVRLLQERGDLRGRQIDTALPHQNWRAAARGMIKNGWLVSRPVLQPPTVRPKTVRTVQLACSPEEAEGRLDGLGRAGSAALERRQAILRFLIREPWPVEVSWVYAVSSGTLQDLQKLEEVGLVILGESETWRDPLERMDITLSETPVLTAAQQTAWGSLRGAIQSIGSGSPVPPPFLLHGITGSGKTEIYMRAVEETLNAGRQAVILVPEIALTPQTVRRFLARFPGQVGLIHSRLSPGERFDTWRRARLGKLRVIVGPRSALFTPLPALGLIVLDECHDPAYHQEDTPPNYDAVESAIAYARLAGCLIVLGSATPDVSMYHRALQERWTLLQLPVRILAHKKAVEAQLAELGTTLPETVKISSEEASAAALNLPPVKIVDMRQELKAGNRTIFSRELKESLEHVLKNRQQAILFLNRRGTATYVFCRQCGYSLKCPRCDLPLTLHNGEENLVCHTCNYRRQVPKVCPQCSSPQIRQFGTGTEKVESDIQELFPGVHTLRWDAETTRQKGAHDFLLQAFMNHQADILIGTQMLAKGLDLPLVTLVGVVLADVGIQLPDYNAGERTFQLLTQVAGRAGRSLLGGKVILQTFQPDHYAIRAASQHDYSGFYRQELEYRKKLRYPPFTRLVRLELRHDDAAQVEAGARAMAVQIERWICEGDHRGTEMIGPVPCFFGKQNNLYRWQIVLRGPNPINVLRGRALGDWRVEVNPVSLL